MVYLNRGFDFRWPTLRIDARRQVVDDVDLVPCVQQRLGEMRTDEPCAAGD